MVEKKLTIPQTDLTVTPIGLGSAWWRGDDAHPVLDCFLDLGGTVVDTARIYGFPRMGLCESIIGHWIQKTGHRHDLVLVSKGGHPRVTSMHTPRMTASDMASDLEASLQALHTDYIDLYFYHRDDVSQPVGQLLNTMEQFVKAGKIRYYACSNWTLPRMQEAADYAQAHGLRGFIGNEAFYNVASQFARPQPDDTLITADDAMLAFHRAHPGCVLMPYSALCNGFYHKLLKPGFMDRLTLKSSFYYSEENLRRADPLRSLMDKYGATVTQVLVGFFLSQDLPMLPLIGCGSEAHLRDMMGALDIPWEGADFVPLR